MRVNAPVEKELGLTVVRTGVGFHSVTLLFPTALESAALTASISTDPVFGKLAGAEYCPEEVIVPMLVDPPATWFTSQLTFPFEDPLTCAVNVWLAPARTLAEEGEIVTVMFGGGLFPVDPEDALPQFTCDAAKTSKRVNIARRTVSPRRFLEIRTYLRGIPSNSLTCAGRAGQLSCRTVLGQGLENRTAEPVLRDR